MTLGGDKNGKYFFFTRAVNERKLSRMTSEGTRTPPMQQEELVTGGGTGTVSTRHIETTIFDPVSEFLNFLYLVYLLYCYFTYFTVALIQTAVSICQFLFVGYLL